MAHRDKAAQPRARKPAAWVVRLETWFRAHHRPMPWRNKPTPYAVWISEMMLQQTQVATVLPKFAHFVACFPNVRALAAAEEQAVLKAWEGLGYYARARNLHRAATIIVNELGGRFPRTAAAWRELPGIGAYASAAIASIAEGEAVPAVDGNVMRVMARFWGITADIMRPASRQTVYDALLPHIRRADPNRFNQGLMELGALVCRPRKPLCPSCPLARDCVARKTDRTESLPLKSRPKAGPHHAMVMLVVERQDQVLLARRPRDGLLGGLWEFPQGRRLEGESDVHAVARITRAETGYAVRVCGTLARVKHAFSHFRVTVLPVVCRCTGGALRAAPDGAELRWVTHEALKALPQTKVAREVGRQLGGEKRQGRAPPQPGAR
ncbi:MAG: A/G-specific adenine glycosylase [Verrucomicrobia bacterium]|nr:A/G-specific adenine glycosylase [Verrucomicrobiota bacterium]